MLGLSKTNLRIGVCRIAESGFSCMRLYLYLDSQVAENYRPLYPKVDHYWFKVAHDYELLALQVHSSKKSWNPKSAPLKRTLVCKEPPFRSGLVFRSVLDPCDTGPIRSCPECTCRYITYIYIHIDTYISTPRCVYIYSMYIHTHLLTQIDPPAPLLLSVTVIWLRLSILEDTEP